MCSYSSIRVDVIYYPAVYLKNNHFLSPNWSDNRKIRVSKGNKSKFNFNFAQPQFFTITGNGFVEAVQKLKKNEFNPALNHFQ